MKNLKNRAKYLEYMLGRRPDEFGLVPDENGFVKIKELIKAASEEDGFYLTKGLINEIVITLPESLIEADGKLIRVKNREMAPEIIQSDNPPKILYLCARRKAHAHVLEKGISPGDNPYLILTQDKEFAHRLGKRRDQMPILLTVQTRIAKEHGVTFFSFGDVLFLSGEIPNNCFTAPPLPKEQKEKKAVGTSKNKDSKKGLKKTPDTPGSFFPDLSEEKSGYKKGRNGKVNWQKNKKRLRREKRQTH